jgi:hypothetical protein
MKYYLISVHFLTKIEQKSYGVPSYDLRYLNDQETISRYSPYGHIGFIAHVVLADALTATIVNKNGYPIRCTWYTFFCCLVNPHKNGPLRAPM